MPGSRTSRTPVRVAAWSCVLVLHALLLALLAHSGKSTREPPARVSTKRVDVRLLPMADPAPTAARSKTPSTSSRREARATIARDVVPESASIPTAPAAITLGSGQAAPLPQPAGSQSQQPLDLTLRHGAATPPSLREQMLADPRANSRGRTPEARMASTLGDAALTEENLGDGRWRFRQNGHCLEARPSRAGQLDPYANLPRPNLLGNCY